MLSGSTLKNMKQIEQAVIDDLRARLKATIEEK